VSEILEGVVARAQGSIATETDLIAAVAGAGSVAAIVEVLRSWFPSQTEGMADETVAAIGGFLLFYYGDRVHALMVPFGFGAFLSAVGAWSSEFTGGLLLALKKKE
jgi:hypothetical protein